MKGTLNVTLMLFLPWNIHWLEFSNLNQYILVYSEPSPDYERYNDWEIDARRNAWSFVVILIVIRMKGVIGVFD